MDEGENRQLVVIGVDTHKDLHVAVALDALGVRLGSCSSPQPRRGTPSSSSGVGGMERQPRSASRARARTGRGSHGFSASGTTAWSRSTGLIGPPAIARARPIRWMPRPPPGRSSQGSPPRFRRPATGPSS